MKELTREQKQQFRLLYGRRDDLELAEHFGLKTSEVEDLAAQLCLGKDKRTFPGYRRMPRWKPEEVERLRVLFPDLSNHEVARRLGRTTKSVISKAHKLGLTKSNSRKVEMGRENVALRKDRS